MPASYEKFLQKFPQTKIDQILAPLNTMHIGGPADLYYKLTDLDQLPNLIQEAQREHIPFFILGGGSNTIFADEGFHGLVIHIQARKISLENDLIGAEAGALLSQVVQFSLNQGFAGMEHFMGLPGTIGGAVRGNAGAFGSEIKDVFAKALIYDDQGLHEAGPEYFNFSYRFSNIKKTHAVLLKIYLKLKKVDPSELSQVVAEARDIVKNRISKQPKGYCSGSFFKNPGTLMGKPNDPQLKAGYLLEQAGCKGLQVGHMKVSNEHANWILNLGEGTQKDLVDLAAQMKVKVLAKFNIELEREVQLVGKESLL